MTDRDGLPLGGKVAIVTGGARNIGRGVALALAEDGAAVVVNARTDGAAAAGVVAEIESAGGQAMAYVGDVTDEAVVGAMVQATLAAYGRIDILVSNAAFRRQQPFLEITLAARRRDSV